MQLNLFFNIYNDFGNKKGEIIMTKEVEFSPIEDLMEEHSILRRALLIYEECIRRMNHDEDFDPDLIAQATNVIKVIIIFHHALLEHEYIFPRFREAGKYVEMCDILTDQHGAADEQEKIILEHANKDSINNPETKEILINALKKSIRVFRPHIDREDTEMFPEFKTVVTPYEFYELGKKFKEIEYQKWGENGHKQMVDKIIHVEKALGINELDSFTPKP